MFSGIDTVTDEDVLASLSHDDAEWAAVGKAVAAVRPRTTAEVQEVVRECGRRGLPVVARGAGTGLSGGANAVDGCVIVDLSRMNRILRVDTDNMIAVVQPGVVNDDLKAAVAGHGLWYPPDPASAPWSTIGGNVATNAGGLCCLKYGVTRDYVLALEAVVGGPAGEYGTAVRLGHNTTKGVAGYDLTSLFVGSEGTLGVVVGATVKLRPFPELTLTAAAAYDDVAAAARACSALAKARREPSMLELLDHLTLEVIDRAQGTDFAGRGSALVIAQADGPGAVAEIAAISEVLSKEATWSEQGVDVESSDRLVAARRLALPSIEKFGRALIEDICVPRSRLVDAFRGVEEIARRHDVAIYSFAHAGDGNLHPIVSFDASATEVPPEVIAAGDDIFSLAISLGGTVTGEHGIGTLKREWLAREIGPDAHALQRSVKAAFDPLGILNPGKGI